MTDYAIYPDMIRKVISRAVVQVEYNALNVGISTAIDIFNKVRR